MIITGLVAKNCYSFDKITLSFDEFPVVQIIGNNLDEKRISNEESNEFYSNANGVGKTNLYNLIIQALYSRDIYKTKKAYLSNLYSKEKFSIVVYLLIEKDIYQIYYNANECVLKKNSKVFIEGRQKVTDFFEELIPFDLFLRLTYVSPKVYFPFFESTNKEQQEFLSLIFKDLLTLKNKLPKIKEERQQLQKRSVELEKEQHHLEQQIAQTYEEEKPLPKKFEICDQTAEINLLNQEKGKLEEQFTRYKELQELRKLIQIKPCTYNEKKYISLISEGKTLKNKINEIQKTINKLKNVENVANCPTCLQPIDRQATIQTIQQLEEKLYSLQSDLEVCKSEYNEMSIQKKIYEKNEKYLQQLKEIENEERKFNIEKLRTSINQINQRIKNLQETQKEEERKLKEYQDLVTKIKIFNEKQKLIKSQISLAKTKLIRVNQELLENKKAIQVLLTLEEVCNKVVVAKQIPNRLKILESFINEELANYTSQYSVTLRMKNDKIIREITKEGKTYPIENLSSGEKTRLNIALLFAIRHILTVLKKDIYNINIVFFDEIDALDTSGRNILIETIKEYGLNQFIISHKYFDSNYPVLELVRKNNKTTLKEH